jgi:hypothetical protein
MAKATLSGGQLLLALGGTLFVLNLIAVAYLTGAGFDALRPGALTIAQLGQLGDSFAWVTSTFAVLAAVGAWQSYESQQSSLKAQRDAIEQEKQRIRQERFDAVFFQITADLERRIEGLNLGMARFTGDTLKGVYGVPALAAFVNRARKQEVEGPAQSEDAAYSAIRATEGTQNLSNAIQAAVLWLGKFEAEGLDARDHTRYWVLAQPPAVRTFLAWCLSPRFARPSVADAARRLGITDAIGTYSVDEEPNEF